MVRLYRVGVGQREVSRLLQMGRNTVRRYGEALPEEGILEGPVHDLPELALLKDAGLKRVPAPAAPAQIRSPVACRR